jgi:hypothetical protein
LPASPAALRAAGVEHTGQFTNSAQLADARLPMLGDVFATPAWLPGHNVFSIGDVAIWVGLGWFLWRTCRPPQRLSRHRVPGPLYTGRHVNPGWHDLPGRHRSAWSVQLPRPARLTWPRVA